MRPWRPAAAPPPAGALASGQLQTVQEGPRCAHGGLQQLRRLPVPRHPPSFRRPTEGHRRAAAAPLPCRCPGIRPALAAPPGFAAAGSMTPGPRGPPFPTAGELAEGVRTRHVLSCSRPLRYTGAQAGPWRPAAPLPPSRCPGRSQRLPCLLCPNWTQAQLYKLVSVDLPAVFVGS